MFLSPPLQIIPFSGFFVMLFAKMKNEVLYNVAHMLVSLHVLANAITFYILASLVTGNWTANSNGVSPVRWLACLALPVFLASRSLRNHIVTSSGAIAVLQVGFVLTLANLSFAFCFGAYLFWFELVRPQGYEPKTFLNILCELGFALHLSIFHLIEIGNGTTANSILGPEGPLDFRSNFLQTWLSISLMGSLSVSIGNSFYSTLLQSCLKGGLIGTAYLTGVIIAAGGLTSIPQGRAFALAPNQLHIIGLSTAGGLFGAGWVSPLRALIWPNVRISDPPPPKGDHYGLYVLTSIISGLLLPRFALAMDASELTFWNNLASLSIANAQ